MLGRYTNLLELLFLLSDNCGVISASFVFYLAFQKKKLVMD